MAHQDVLNRRFSKCVVDRKHRTAGIAENCPYTFALQHGPDNLCPGHRCSRGCRLRSSGLHSVTAPCEAEETRLAYLAKTPVAYRGCGAFQLRRRSSIWASLSSAHSKRLSTSNTITSPSRNAAIGPPLAASG